ncbi:MAG: hypothetical protein KatS3mg057_2664 [Herpetosiphonaceae bacterium]|nr:MAG: hypothetical protein KatS3mg057_2664 [Herpetosiphonaceae bacterium]
MDQTVAPAQPIFHTYPPTIYNDRAAFVDLSVINQSGYDWRLDDQHPPRLSYHWLDDRGVRVVHDGARSFFPKTIAYGEECRMFLRIHPPPAPGHYTLLVDIVREGLGWFELQYPIHIECLPAPQPRVILVNGNCLVRDAIGNNIVQKLRLLQQWGFAPLLLTELIDRRLPLELQALMVEVNQADILTPSPDLQWAANHFWQASLYLFDYSTYYPLVELIRVVSDGPVIFDYHGVTPPSLWSSSIGLSDVELGVKNVSLVAWADYAIAHSEFTRKELVDTGLIDPTRIFVFPYVVPTESFRPGRRRSSVPQLKNSQDPVLLYVGRMASNKRIDMLIRMVGIIKQRYPHVQLLLVGDNTSLPYQEVVTAAQQLIKDLNLEENVIFTGQVDNLPDYYDACDVYVTSSLHEGFCIPVVEAMASGKPVVASNATALPWTIGDAGLLVDPDDLQGFATCVQKLLDAKYAS